ncbi:unnamed protein product [Dibothriocephalus latus]|uniref:Uncharacterized protein n=1 Tax=Dibothriocephalus latus TaxID=60516 RepID=A0A3P6TIF2_DIBLA|nr:unnamed protein product [Dibothriocephalus latus]
MLLTSFIAITMTTIRATNKNGQIWLRPYGAFYLPLTGQCYVVGRDRQQQEIDSESGLVVEFLRVAQEETVNIVTLGVALLLQLSAVEKPWCLRFATAYLKLSSRIRPSLPAWSPNHVESDTPEQRHTDSCGTYELLPASLIRLRSRPSPSQLARLHLTYLEVRLDALAYTQSTSNRHAPLEDPLSALDDAVLADSKRFHTSDQTIPHHDLTLLVRAISRLPEDSLEARTLQIRVVWMNYELSSLAHDYEGMREYLLQVKEFVCQNGPFHRASSTRNHLINSARIGELLTEVDDLAAGDRLLALSNIGDFEALISCFEECLRSCSIAKRKVSSFAFRSGLTALDEALHLGTVALDLLVRCWDVVVSVMSTSDLQSVFAEEKAEVEGELPANMLAQSHLFRYWSESASGDQGKVPTACESEQVPLSLTFGHVCSGLRLAVDWLAWRLKAVGVLGLQLPPVSLSLVASVYEMLFQLESDLPLNYLPEKLAIYRALLDLRKTPENSPYDWQIAEVVFLFYHPSVVPEYDSLKTMSISAELSGWLTEVVKLLPTDIEAQLIPEDQIKLCMSSRGPIPRHNFLPRLAIDFYVRDLRVEPRHADSWASLALIYSSQLEQILNMTDLRTERVSSRSVSKCLRCFEVAIELQPSFVTLLTERGCLAYQLHSYAARLLKKAYTFIWELHKSTMLVGGQRLLATAEAAATILRRQGLCAQKKFLTAPQLRWAKVANPTAHALLPASEPGPETDKSLLQPRAPHHLSWPPVGLDTDILTSIPPTPTDPDNNSNSWLVYFITI